MAKTYAHTTFKIEVDEWGMVKKKAEPGDEVTKTQLGVDDATWQSYLDRGIVSEEKYPDVPTHISPNEHYARMENAYYEGDLSEKEEKEYLAKQGGKGAMTPSQAITPSLPVAPKK